MLDYRNHVPQSAAEILGDLTALAEQLGEAQALSQFSLAALGPAPAGSVAGLERFLENYRATVLFPAELPAVVRAHEHAARGHVRELIALDAQSNCAAVSELFATASAHVGRTQLRRLRPLRGERVVHRYLAAVEQGEAKGWHTLVYGLVLAVYSLPLRQGLTHFAHQTLGGFVHAAGHRCPLTDADRERLLNAQCAPVSAAVEQAILRHSAVAALNC